MNPSDKDVDKIEEALVTAYRQQEDLQLPPEWRQQVMKDIKSMAGPATFPAEKESTSPKLKIIAVLASLSLAVMVGWLILANLDWEDPWLHLHRDVAALESHHLFWLEAGDEHSGLRSLTVTVIQEELKIEVLSKNLEPPGGAWFSPSNTLNKVKFPLHINSQALGLEEGEATLVITVRDLSWSNGFQGRQTILKKKFVIHQSR